MIEKLFIKFIERIVNGAGFGLGMGISFQLIQKK